MSANLPKRPVEFGEEAHVGRGRVQLASSQSGREFMLRRGASSLAKEAIRRSLMVGARTTGDLDQKSGDRVWFLTSSLGSSVSSSWRVKAGGRYTLTRGAGCRLGWDAASSRERTRLAQL